MKHFKLKISNFLFLFFAFSATVAAAGDPENCAKNLINQVRSEQETTKEIEAEKIEREAIQVLHDLVLTPEKAQQSLVEWFKEIRSHQETGIKHLTVMEHTTLVHLLRSGFLKDNPDDVLIGEIQDSVIKSWLNFTAENRNLDFILEHSLPESVLKQASDDERLFQARVMEVPQDSIGSADPLETADKLSEKKSAQIRAYALKGLTMVAAGLALTSGVADSIPGGKLLASGIIGYIAASNMEVLIHKFIMHASPRLLNVYRKFGFVGRIMMRARRNHLTHHALFPAKHYTTGTSEWTDAEEILDKQSRPTGMKKIPARDKIFRENGHREGEGHRNRYGLSMDNIALLNVELTMLPVSMALSYAFFGFHDLPGWLAMSAGSQYAVFGIRTLHSLLHMPAESHPAALKFLMRSRWIKNYVKWVSRYHFQHHVDMKTNFALFMPFFPNGKEPDLKKLLLLWSLDAKR